MRRVMLAFVGRRVYRRLAQIPSPRIVSATPTTESVPCRWKALRWAQNQIHRHVLSYRLCRNVCGISPELVTTECASGHASVFSERRINVRHRKKQSDPLRSEVSGPETPFNVLDARPMLRWSIL